MIPPTKNICSPTERKAAPRVATRAAPIAPLSSFKKSKKSDGAKVGWFRRKWSPARVPAIVSKSAGPRGAAPSTPSAAVVRASSRMSLP